MRVLLVLAAVAHARLSGRPAAPAPTRSALGRCSAVAMAVGGDDTPLDMGLLSQRITSLQRSGVDDSARGSVLPILVLDSMLPRQKITISMDDEAGLKLIKDCVDRYDSKLGVHGVDPVTNLVNPAGTQVLITSRSGCFVELVGQRRYLLTGKPVRIEETYYTCELEWCCVDEAAGKELIAAAGALEPLIARWMQLVRQGREKEPRQLDEVLADLGPIPSVGDPEERALWVAALINPLPGLGVAYEIRPAMLATDSAAQRLLIVTTALEKSISHMDGSAPLW